ncbi:bacterioferritin-associated ferredoxin [Celerinatantimonas yamalensis]|uniref:Bacterioferritin-associated ferredoxin n=1 Tax=Celerinatantimonas yamalensis TaxID=559956 RepID=A0ABW9G9G7_9GAMM
MFICLCQGITDSQIRQAVRDGNMTLAEVRQKLPVATQCGRCTQSVKDVINEELAQSADFYEVA